MAVGEKSAKKQNIGWIWTVVVADALALAALAYPGALDQDVLSWRSALKLFGAGVAPVAVLLLTSLLSSDVKAIAVFGRFRHPLPGHRAFSTHAEADPRVDVSALKKNVGAFPEHPREQNTLWYRLFKKVERDPMVLAAHRNYLLFRDLAALSVVLGVVAPVAFLIFRADPAVVLSAAALFMAQYAATAIAARNEGVKLVRNVLALHSLKRR